MTRLQMSELRKLSVQDKLKVVQTLWDDIAKEQSYEGLPAAHKKFLTNVSVKLGLVMLFLNLGLKFKVNMINYNELQSCNSIGS
jgi:hypothetical protein